MTQADINRIRDARCLPWEGIAQLAEEADTDEARAELHHMAYHKMVREESRE